MGKIVLEKPDIVEIRADDEVEMFQREEGGVIKILATVRKSEKYDSNYAKYYDPPVPRTYEPIQSVNSWRDGYVISNGIEELVWVPVGWLKENGSLDGKSFDSPLGWRKYSECFDSQKVIESFSFKKFVESTKKNGGFYVPWELVIPAMGTYPSSKKPVIWTEQRLEACPGCFVIWDTVMQWLVQKNWLDATRSFKEIHKVLNYAGISWHKKNVYYLTEN